VSSSYPPVRYAGRANPCRRFCFRRKVSTNRNRAIQACVSPAPNEYSQAHRSARPSTYGLIFRAGGMARAMTGKDRPTVAHEPVHRLLRFANNLDFNDQDHHNPQQAASMVVHRILLSDTPVGPIPAGVSVFAGKRQQTVTAQYRCVPVPHQSNTRTHRSARASTGRSIFRPVGMARNDRQGPVHGCP
jgi:hypothetical protein